MKDKTLSLIKLPPVNQIVSVMAGIQGVQGGVYFFLGSSLVPESHVVNLDLVIQFIVLGTDCYVDILAQLNYAELTFPKRSRASENVPTFCQKHKCTVADRAWAVVAVMLLFSTVSCANRRMSSPFKYA